MWFPSRAPKKNASTKPCPASPIAPLQWLSWECPTRPGSFELVTRYSTSRIWTMMPWVLEFLGVTGYSMLQEFSRHKLQMLLNLYNSQYDFDWLKLQSLLLHSAATWITWSLTCTRTPPRPEPKSAKISSDVRGAKEAMKSSGATKTALRFSFYAHWTSAKMCQGSLNLLSNQTYSKYSKSFYNSIIMYNIIYIEPCLQSTPICFNAAFRSSNWRTPWGRSSP